MKENLKLLLVVAAGLIAGAMLHKCQSPPGNIPDFTECVTDTTIVYDTIPYIEPTPQSELALGTRTYTLPKYYFIGVGAGGEPRCSNDSAIVELPIIQRHYADSTYEAWVSGPIDPRLDSVRVFIPTTLITKREWKPPKRWHIGPTIGYGYTPQGLQPYIGVSITYSIISF